MFKLKEKITYWNPSYSTGQANYGIGVVGEALSASSDEEVIASQGKERKIARLSIYTRADVKRDSLVIVGDYAGQTVTEVKALNTGYVPERVLQVSKIPSRTILKRLLI